MAVRTVWGIDVGTAALKALKLCEDDAGVRADEFEVIDYGQPREQAVGEAIGRLAGRLTGSHVVVSVPGASGCTRFVHLPPTDISTIPSLVRFEAAQQVPFPIAEAIWRWQTFRDPRRPSAPDVDAGIFALKKSALGEMLLQFSVAGVNVDAMQLAPLALYNFMARDGLLADEDATMLLDVGAGAIDVVVGEGRRIWTQTAEVGAGEAGAGPLAERIARIVADYAAHYPDSKLARVIAAGGALRQGALREAVQSRLAAPVECVERFEGLAAGGADLGDRAAVLAVACGLALQGLGRTPVHVNFLPSGIAHKWSWEPPRPGRVRRLLQRLLGRRSSPSKPPGEGGPAT